MMIRLFVWSALAGATTLLSLGAPARADVAVGDKITPENVDKVKDLISPGHRVVRRARLPDHHRRDQADRVAEGLQGGHREVLAAR